VKNSNYVPAPRKRDLRENGKKNPTNRTHKKERARRRSRLWGKDSRQRRGMKRQKSEGKESALVVVTIKKGHRHGEFGERARDGGAWPEIFEREERPSTLLRPKRKPRRLKTAKETKSDADDRGKIRPATNDPRGPETATNNEKKIEVHISAPGETAVQENGFNSAGRPWHPFR